MAAKLTCLLLAGVESTQSLPTTAEPSKGPLERPDDVALPGKPKKSRIEFITWHLQSFSKCCKPILQAMKLTCCVV